MEPPSRHSIEITNRSGRRVPPAPLRSIVDAALRRHCTEPSRVSILLTDDESIRELNEHYRHVDGATDVLSFPAGEALWPGSRHKFLGDIAISIPTAARQAAARGVPVAVEVAHLAAHGVLHLLGYEDSTEADAEVMVAEMNRAAAAAGLPEDSEWGSLLHEARP